jgi:serine/threonine-protein kinase RsbW
MAREHSPSQAHPRGGWTPDSDHRDQAGGASSDPDSTTPMAALESDIHLTVPARAENVAVVRHVLGAFAEAVGLPARVRDDMRLAVTEACTNVVRHAYGGGDGAIDVVMRPEPDALEVTVSDRGRGIGCSPDTSGPGLGLRLIAALTDSLEIVGSDGGSRLVMSFGRRGKPAMGAA